MQNDLAGTLKNHDIIVKLYKAEFSKDRKTRDSERDWRTYEQRLALRIRKATEEIEPIIDEAYSIIKIKKSEKSGRPPKVPVTKKILLLLLKDIFQLSNRKMANFLAFFTALTGIDISYKTVERVYSDELATMIIHNMFMIMVKRKGIKNADTCGDGTGYSLTVTKHYRNEREKELRKPHKKDNEKNDEKGEKKKLFARSFGLMDLDTKMYIGYGTSMKSEHDAFVKAKEMAIGFGITIDTIRLDKLFSYQGITKEFNRETMIFIIPKTNATIRGSSQWKDIMRSYVFDPMEHLKEYFKRNCSESGFSADKRTCGWKIWQIRDDRIDTSLMCKGVWHNLLLLE